ncbi:MAG: ABC transporter ATP-binding protein [Clostridium sp.]|jgi:ABC-type multidrug transport system ATPase subunit|nr:ABC transporter ATP-binding protein [Clostridium sp.]
MIEAIQVTKKYGKVLANDNISVRVDAGEMGILLGPNGAGKSTLIKAICGLVRFDGTITIDGHDNHSIEAKKLLGYIPEIPALYPMLTVYEHLEFIAKAYRLENWKERANKLLTQFELDDKQRKLGKELSKGMQQKVSVCCALLHEPKAIIFDEPLVGLDPHGIRELKNLMTELKNNGCALLVSTHMIESVEENWDTTFILMQGQLKQVCNRQLMAENQKLEDIFFAITEGQSE